VRRTLPALPLLLGLLVGLTASETFAQEAPCFGAASQVGFAEAGPSSGDASNPFVPEDAAVAGKGNSQPAKEPAGGSGSGVKGESCSCGCCCEDCQSCGCCSGHICLAGCDACAPVGISLFAGVESFRGIADGDHQNNGLVVGGNLGVPLPGLKDYGIGVQFGASFGAYDLDGRTFPDGALGDPPSAVTDVGQQTFFTLGVFHRATEKVPLNIGFGHDWMINDAYGVFATSPTISQWRAQLGYCLSAWNEIGVWTTVRDSGDGKVITFGGIPANVLSLDVSYRAIDQCNFYWHHNYDSGADSWVWMGFLEDDAVAGLGHLGSYTVGVTVQVPLTDRVALYADGQYMRPAASAGPIAAQEEAFSVGFGLAFFPYGNAKNRSVAGSCWMPVLPVANNGSFLVNTNGAL